MLEELKNKITKILKGEVKLVEPSPEKQADDKKTPKNKGKNFMTNMMILFLSGVLLVIVSSIFKPEILPTDENKSKDKAVQTSSDGMNSPTTENSYKEKVQNELISTLEHIDGVGSVRVMIYFEGGEEQIPAFNTNDSTSTTDEKDPSGGTRKITQDNGGNTVVMTNEGDNQQPFILKKYNPKITGICVVAEGASDKVTELRVRQAVTILFGLPENKVQVYPMKK